MMSDRLCSPKKLFLYRPIMETHKSDQIRVSGSGEQQFLLFLAQHFAKSYSRSKIMIISCYSEFFEEQVGYRIIHILNNLAFFVISSIIAQADTRCINSSCYSLSCYSRVTDNST